ncbi:MAG TPA: hypothetical protein VKU44_05200, partial [Terriglobia bacterium]|nr:hypothetical protein [Terriglobia bacterium]
NVVLSPVAVVPVHERKIWIVLAPTQGVEDADTAGIYADIASLERNPGMRLRTASHGVWAFEWTPPAGAKTLAMAPAAQAYAPGWVMKGTSATVVRKGPPSNWAATSTHTPGYVVDQAYWRVLPGAYRASFTLSVASGTYANAELWDATTGVLLGRLVLHRTSGMRTFALTAHLRKTIGQPSIGGHYLWAIKPQTLPGDALEIRVWSPGRAPVTVYRVQLTQLSGRRIGGSGQTAQQVMSL